jgi:hypothetical protein
MIVLPSETSYSVSNVGGRDKWSTLMEYNKDSREEYAKKVIEEVQEGKSVEEIRREMDRRAREGRERKNKLMEESNRSWKEHQDLVKKIKEKVITASQNSIHLYLILKSKEQVRNGVRISKEGVRLGDYLGKGKMAIGAGSRIGNGEYQIEGEDILEM